jgi:hypothetical protein
MIGSAPVTGSGMPMTRMNLFGAVGARSVPAEISNISLYVPLLGLA